MIHGQIYVGMSRLLRRWTAVPLPVIYRRVILCLMY
nr:MAG TPA: hypothetical protein [Caudoviricetes sp.]